MSSWMRVVMLSATDFVRDLVGFFGCRRGCFEGEEDCSEGGLIALWGCPGTNSEASGRREEEDSASALCFWSWDAAPFVSRR